MAGAEVCFGSPLVQPVFGDELAVVKFGLFEVLGGGVMSYLNGRPVNSDGQLAATYGGTVDHYLNGLSRDVSSYLVVADSATRNHTLGGLAFDANNRLVISTSSAVNHYLHGLPFASDGALCAEAAAVDHWSNGWPMTVNNKVSLYGYSLEQDFTTGVGDWTFTRTGSQTYEDINEVLQTETTTDVAVVTYDGGVAQGVLLEDTVDQLLASTEDFGTTWVEFGHTVTTNDTTAPDGTLTADKLVETDPTAVHAIYQNGLTVVSGQNYTLTYYVKPDTGRDWVQLLLFSAGFSTLPYANFNVTTGAVGTVDEDVTAYSNEDAGNGWRRLSISMAATGNSSSVGVEIATVTGTSSVRAESHDGSTANAVWVWGGNFTETPFPVSYIKDVNTLGATGLTRSWAFPANNFSFHFKCRINADRGDHPAENGILFNFSDNSTSDYLACYMDSGDGIVIGKRVNTGTQTAPTESPATWSAGDLMNIRGRCDSGGYSYWVNDETVIRTTSGDAPTDWTTTLTHIFLGEFGGATGLETFITGAYIKIYNEALSDAYLEALT